MSNKIKVKKLNGEVEPYKEEKLRQSLKNSGAKKKDIDKIMKKVEDILYDGIQTKKLYSFVKEKLKKLDSGTCCRYNLKKAMMDLRISGGFVFEDFIAKVLKKKGYNTEVGKTFEGKNIPHEIDVDAKKGKERIMVETKHHHKPGIKTDIQTGLYIYARFLELDKKFSKPMLITNTKFSDQVRKYAKGVKMNLMGWKYPQQNSLEKNIEKYKLYPITVLDISRKEQIKHFKNNILTIDELKEQNISNELRKQISKVIQEKTNP